MLSVLIATGVACLTVRGIRKWQISEAANAMIRIAQGELGKDMQESLFRVLKEIEEDKKKNKD